MDWLAIMFLSLGLGWTSVCAADYSAPVIGVLDGDTIEVLNGHHTERIRLSGIDCPETGNKAKELVFGKEVTLRCGFRL